MGLGDRYREFRRIALLDAIPLDDLQDMHKKIMGFKGPEGAYSLRLLIYKGWEVYKEEIRKWCNNAIDGKSDHA